MEVECDKRRGSVGRRRIQRDVRESLWEKASAELAGGMQQWQIG